MPGGTTSHLADRAALRHWARDTIRYGDTDRQGHVNNAVFATFCETGRCALIHDPAAPLAPPGCAFVIARLVIDYRAELHWPGVVDVGTAVLAVGRSSVTLGQGVFRQDGACVATAETVIVLTEVSTGRPAPLPDAARARLAGLAHRERTAGGDAGAAG